MSTTEALPQSNPAVEDDGFQYRTLATPAIAALALGILSLLIFVAGRDSLTGSLMYAPFPLLALWMALRTRTQLRERPGQYTGGPFAAVGAALAAISLVGGIGYSTFVYANEVPEGYRRLTFIDLRPDEADARGDLIVPKETALLDGEKVFLKGYVRQGKYSRLRRFLLVRDNQECCYGDLSNVKYYDQVSVEMPQNQLVEYDTGVFRVHGTLHIRPDNLRRRGGATVYSLDADGVQ